MLMDKMKVAKALSKVIEPQTGKDLISLNIVTGLEVDDKTISFTIEVPSANYPHKGALNMAAQTAMLEVYPEAEVHVHMSVGKQPQRPTAPRRILPQVKNIIAVASGKGGVGKSTVSVNLALSLKSQGARVGLIDADLYGPSIPTMLGLKGLRPKVKDVNGKPVLLPLDYKGMPVMSIGFIIEPEQAVVLRGPRLGGIIKQFFNDCEWPELDYLVIDLPPGTGDIQLTLVQTVPVTGVVLVTTPQQVSYADAVKAMNMFLLPNVNVPILGVVENMSWFTPAELPDNKYYLFGKGAGEKLSAASSSGLLGQVPLIQSVQEGGDSGNPAAMQSGPAQEIFEGIAKKLVAHVEKRNAERAPTSPVEIKI
ncbi:MAG: Mrp/NBP35 family ATP-binding protein [Saprospiraceae bacterium]|nr:Mrp/NBP35 family ATP-binding protein [Saprospiraceae bacterium]